MFRKHLAPSSVPQTLTWVTHNLETTIHCGPLQHCNVHYVY